jgi:hypothetical protein
MFSRVLFVSTLEIAVFYLQDATPISSTGIAVRLIASSFIRKLLQDLFRDDAAVSRYKPAQATIFISLDLISPMIFICIMV